MPDQVDSDIIGNDLVHKSRMVNGPAGFGLAELLSEFALGRGVLPSLPDVGRELCVDVVGKLVLELLAQRLLVQLR